MGISWATGGRLLTEGASDANGSAAGVGEPRAGLQRPCPRARYRPRASARHHGHLDHLRDEDVRWARPVPPLDVGPLLEIGTSARGPCRPRSRAIATGAPNRAAPTNSYEALDSAALF